MKLSSRHKTALIYALTKHEGQNKKGTDTPHAAHLLNVSALVLEAGGDEDMTIAGLLQVAPEDQGGKSRLDQIREVFEERVALMVEGCTDLPSENSDNNEDSLLRMTPYLEHRKPLDQDALTVSLAGTVSNARAPAKEPQLVEDGARRGRKAS